MGSDIVVLAVESQHRRRATSAYIEIGATASSNFLWSLTHIPDRIGAGMRNAPALAALSTVPIPK
jgi:hypothetical protein